MNKSIILVMCDILVLSAMSLSSGGFSEIDELVVAKTQSIDFDVVSRDAYETLQQKFEEIERSASEQLEKAMNEAEAARVNEANAKAVAETAQKNEAEAKAQAKEALKREVAAKMAEKAAKEAEALSKSKAEKAAAQEARARQEAEAARVNEANAKAVAETAKKNEAAAKAQAEEASAEAERARKAEAFAKAQAEVASAKEACAQEEAEIARAGEAQAKAEAEVARKNEETAKGLAEKATVERNHANAMAEKFQAELDEINARKNALIGDIPQNIAWKMEVFTKGKKGEEPKTVYSLLFSLDSGGFLFVELPCVGVTTYSNVDSVLAYHGELSVTGELFRVDGHDDWLFVKIGDSSKLPHIGFGVENFKLEGNFVFWPEENGKCSGFVDCYKDSEENVTCSSSAKIEKDRTLFQVARLQHAVYEGCLIVSTCQHAIGAIVRGGKNFDRFDGVRKCDVLPPITVNDLLSID